MILSGTGSDGTLGLKRIKEEGGIAIAQDPADALVGSKFKVAPSARFTVSRSKVQGWDVGTLNVDL